MAKKSVHRLSLGDAAYLAGLIDGEGTITLSRRHANERRQLVVSISSTEHALVDWARTATGVGKITRKRTDSPHHAPGLAFSVSNVQALDLLRQILPHLRSYKRTRAALALERYRALTPRNGKYTEQMSADRAAFEQAFLAISTRSPR